VVVVEPTVTEEKLRQLLAEGAESESLDYKETLDLRSNADVIEIAKDLGAMQLLGGFIVVGADSAGRLTSRYTEDAAAQLDEARLRAQVTRYLPEPLDLLVATHSIDGRTASVIYTGPHQDCFVVFRADGQYTVGDPPRERTVFRQGDVFARHGSASERWRQEDIDRIRRCLIAREKDGWRRELAEEIVRIAVGASGRALASGTALGFTWRVDAETFRATAIELARSGDDVPIRLLVRGVASDARHLMGLDEAADELATMFDRLACLAALGIVLARPGVIDAAIDGLGRVYDLGFHREHRGWTVQPAELWLSALTRVYGVGALAVREQDWRTVRLLALREGEPEGSRRWFITWIRHGLTMAARSNLFVRQEDDRRIELSLLSLALEVVRHNECLRPDAAEDDERLLDSLCQFDMLAVLAAIADAKSLDTRYYYTSFARFYGHRTEPIVRRLIKDEGMRSAIAPLSDDDLAHALREVDRRATTEAFRYAGWMGFDDPEIVAFLEAHPPRDQ
jgi:hypothetical protein